jgi:predicted dehydrogenase
MSVLLVGSGFIGPVHLEALRRLGRPIAGVVASSPEKATSAAMSLGVPRGYPTLADALADPAVTSVHLTSPNRCHFDQSRMVLEAGRHVICEKPLAMTPAESRALVDLAVKSPGVAAVCYNVRFYPLCLEMRERIAAGEIGDLHHVTGSYVQDWLLHDTDFNWRVLAEEGGSLRAIADIGTHWLDLMQFVVGQHVSEVCADLRTVLPTRYRPAGTSETFSSKLEKPKATVAVPIDTEDYGSVLFHLGGGAGGVFSVSQVFAGKKNAIRLEIAGSKGSFAWDSERPNELWIGRRDRANELLVRDPGLLAPAVRPFANYPGGHNEGFPDSFKQLFRAIYATIDGSPIGGFPTFADGHREIVLCDAILRSQRSRRWESVAIDAVQ